MMKQIFKEDISYNIFYSFLKLNGVKDESVIKEGPVIKEDYEINETENANKIVIIPVYPDIARMSGNQVDSKLGNKIIDSIAHTLIVPVVTKAVSSMGIPSLDMNNIIIVDRGERAPR